MSKPRVSARIALAASLLTVLLLAAGGSAAGYLVEVHSQRTGRHYRLAAAAAYIQHGAARALSPQWQRALTGKLASLELSAQLTIASATKKRSIYQPRPIAGGSKPQSSSSDPTATYVFPLAGGSGRTLRLNLFALPFDRNRRLLVALVSGLAVLLAGVALLLWAASRWLVAPLRRLNAHVDAVAGGDSIDTRTDSPIREVDNVAAALAGMAARLAQTAEQDARLEAERRLLVSSIAHDLRTPLFSLRGYLDAIASGLGDPEERLDRAREKARQIDRLVTSLFDYARADIEVKPRLQATDLAQAIADTTAAFELAARAQGVELRVAGRTGAPVALDRDGFARALGNVIDNALRQTPRGGAVDVTHGEDTDGVFVRVVDDGPGIPHDLLPHVFDPLVRADDARNGHADGTGLGLTIAARLLQQQGGTIHAANTPDRGAVLTLRLMRARGLEPPGASRPSGT
jgi:signal transduction histidine kinase